MMRFGSGTYNVRDSEVLKDVGRQIQRTIICSVHFLDASQQDFEVDRHCKGQELLDKVFEHLELIEKDYFGLQFADLVPEPDNMRWLEPHKSIRKQMQCPPYVLFFRVKFYVSDPSKLHEEYTRYHFFLQLRKDILENRLVCPESSAALLASYVVQSEIGDFCPEEQDDHYIDHFKFVGSQTQSLLRKIVELHKLHQGQTPADAEFNFLDHAKRLDMYGVDLYHGHDSNMTEIQIGVTSYGIVVFQNCIRINTFSWAKILKISFKRKQFFLSLKSDEDDCEIVIGFSLSSCRACKLLWKSCIEHHTFFRLISPPSQPQKGLFNIGSSFRYSGRTEYQTLEEMKRRAKIERTFHRTGSKLSSVSMRSTVGPSSRVAIMSSDRRLSTTMSSASSYDSGSPITQSPKLNGPAVRETALISGPVGSAFMRSYRGIVGRPNGFASLRNRLSPSSGNRVLAGPNCGDSGGFLSNGCGTVGPSTSRETTFGPTVTSNLSSLITEEGSEGKSYEINSPTANMAALVTSHNGGPSVANGGVLNGNRSYGRNSAGRQSYTPGSTRNGTVTPRQQWHNQSNGYLPTGSGSNPSTSAAVGSVAPPQSSHQNPPPPYVGPHLTNGGSPRHNGQPKLPNGGLRHSFNSGSGSTKGMSPASSAMTINGGQQPHVINGHSNTNGVVTHTHVRLIQNGVPMTNGFAPQPQQGSGNNSPNGTVRQAGRGSPGSRVSAASSMSAASTSNGTAATNGHDRISPKRDSPVLPVGTNTALVNGQGEEGLVLIKMKPDSQGRFGFNIKGGADQKHPIIVSRVAPGSPADTCFPRLNEGDQIYLINGRDVSQHSHDQIVRFIRSASEIHSGELVLTVRPNVYQVGEEGEEPEFQYVPETPHLAETIPRSDLLSQSLLLLRDGLASGAAIVQFEQLYRKAPGMTMNCARSPENIHKNRYRDISPYDTTRVVIKNGPSGDYLNANFVNMEIPASGIVNRYIAAQGPLPHTTADFWQAVWEQLCTTIVMLTATVERGRVKCHQYWPNLYETQDYGTLQITCLKENEMNGCWFRELLVVNKETKEERQISQIQYTAWPDHGVPDDTKQFFKFVTTVRQNRIGTVEPILVHCSAGIGRTGVLILMETAMCLIEANEPVYALDIVRTMRDQRAMLIQTSSQYKFVCEAILQAHGEGLIKPLAEYSKR